jgi:hypothetical protein
MCLTLNIAQQDQTTGSSTATSSYEERRERLKSLRKQPDAANGRLGRLAGLTAENDVPIRERGAQQSETLDRGQN